MFKTEEDTLKCNSAGCAHRVLGKKKNTAKKQTNSASPNTRKNKIANKVSSELNQCFDETPLQNKSSQLLPFVSHFYLGLLFV